ncbi:hypothetical protein CTM94_08030 [Photobacterium leiognathi]|uniref:Uncharacterized protein n=1 Tax=Photobacterium leiognathi TaxID=553611 RepID=A0ABX5GH51_PHOLE|nr:hypothetical protein UB42_17000 [Photobacterium leiognathi]PSV83551.1 hypothetical protein CTM94_08030 [Photobacterium leiognathi]
MKPLLGGKLSLKKYTAQVGETYVMIKALNKLTELGMPETEHFNFGAFGILYEFHNKALQRWCL